MCCPKDPIKKELWKQRISDACKGRKAWNAGIPRSDEFKAEHSARMTGRKHTKEHNAKIGASGIGKKRTEETKRKMSENNCRYWAGKKMPTDMKNKMADSRRGEKSHFWKDGKSFEEYSSEFNKQLKERIRERDGHSCRICSKPEKECSRSLDIHHIDYNKKNNSSENLISLCTSCHSSTNKDREFWEIVLTEKMKENKKEGDKCLR